MLIKVGIHRKAECLANGIQKMSQTIILLCSAETKTKQLLSGLVSTINHILKHETLIIRPLN